MAHKTNSREELRNIKQEIVQLQSKHTASNTERNLYLAEMTKGIRRSMNFNETTGKTINGKMEKGHGHFSIENSYEGRYNEKSIEVSSSVKKSENFSLGKPQPTSREAYICADKVKYCFPSKHPTLK